MPVFYHNLKTAVWQAPEHCQICIIISRFFGNNPVYTVKAHSLVVNSFQKDYNSIT